MFEGDVDLFFDKVVQRVHDEEVIKQTLERFETAVKKVVHCIS
ncbi:hypothetical protein SAMN05444392_104205 [Seinonella peptonophila]|uniref:Uncharacterized protein n=1 Tax=Seinonella peptonophila TaxID=112248 RepID=A0A1M4XA30_9BACL|nr:hypothetical protein SAMN05444392_104205 [Seinonella peptonophila]